jgi:hypothetical protein
MKSGINFLRTRLFVTIAKLAVHKQSNFVVNPVATSVEIRRNQCSHFTNVSLHNIAAAPESGQVAECVRTFNDIHYHYAQVSNVRLLYV